MKPINEQINPKFVIQARKLSQFNRLLQEILPPECRPHVEVANIRQQSLMLITDSPVWTTRLRQLSPKILAFIRDNIPDTQGIHHVQISTRYPAAKTAVAVTPDKKRMQNASTEKTQPAISQKTARLLSQSADSIQHHALKNALLKLARHAAKGSSNTQSGASDKTE
ncbi:MAG TPA: DUF721 domain-containing protein [Gammaproteobacteria bacterium]|nr:DUF721 domain-containing protein [Gammaproteobacteria bacterium]